ncbi:hypothetical protein B296_00052304 [Ensete ventricosum]|uniref:Uncharacterized protein n=1 Tax=Ensete ventricosum TaxID=4639 RepID=A0A426WZ56_ENSVE|nr:hypothetical protein B296_00052304 [Ensete ventricosum]
MGTVAAGSLVVGTALTSSSVHRRSTLAAAWLPLQVTLATPTRGLATGHHPCRLAWPPLQRAWPWVAALVGGLVILIDGLTTSAWGLAVGGHPSMRPTYRWPPPSPTGNASIDIDGIMTIGVMWMPFSCSLRSWAVADICRKMTAKRTESKSSSDGGGRRGQQQRRLWLRCDFVAVSGIGCSKGAATIGGKRGSDVHSYCKGGQQRYRARDSYCCVQFVASRDQDSWQRMIIAGCDVNRLQQKIAAGSFLPQGSLLAVIKEDGSKRSLLAMLGNERYVLQLKG